MAVVHFILSYDISCAYCVNFMPRIANAFPELAPLVPQFDFTIPLLHIQNHNDNCTYMHSCAFTKGAGHFHGETAEHPWTYVNLFSGQARHMSHGNRHDLYNVIYNYWNYKKMIGLRK
jgi:hypothetical protein